MKLRLAFCLVAVLAALMLAGGCLNNPLVKESKQGFFTVKINGKSNIFRAGTGDADANGGGESPASVSFAPRGGLVLTFADVTGRVSCCGDGETFNDADGGEFAGGVTSVDSAGGISGFTHPTRTMFLVGVFTDNSTAKPPGPKRLDASDPGNLTPELFQSFFIGSGKGKQIQVPSTATRLILGFVDGYSFTGAPGSYDDNVGELTANFSIKPR